MNTDIICGNYKIIKSNSAKPAYDQVQQHIIKVKT